MRVCSTIDRMQFRRYFIAFQLTMRIEMSTGWLAASAAIGSAERFMITSMVVDFIPYSRTTPQQRQGRTETCTRASIGVGGQGAARSARAAHGGYDAKGALGRADRSPAQAIAGELIRYRADPLVAAQPELEPVDARVGFRVDAA